MVTVMVVVMLILVMLVMKVVMVVVMMVMVVDGSDVVDSGEWDDGGDERRKGGRGQGGRSRHHHQHVHCTIQNNTIHQYVQYNTIAGTTRQAAAKRRSGHNVPKPPSSSPVL